MLLAHLDELHVHIVDFIQNKINDVTFSTSMTRIVFYQLILWGVLTIFEFHIFWVTSTLLCNNDSVRIKRTL